MIIQTGPEVGGGVASAGRRTACDLPAVLRLQTERSPGFAPRHHRLPVGAGGCCHAQQLPIIADGDRLAGGEDAARHGAPLPRSGARKSLCRWRGQRGQHRSSVGVGRHQTGAMIGLEGAQAAPSKPCRLVFPDCVGSELGLRVDRGDLGINGEECGIAADQDIRCILRSATIGAALLDRRRHRSRLGSCREARKLQCEQTDYRQAPRHRAMIVPERSADNKFRKSGNQRTLS